MTRAGARSQGKSLRALREAASCSRRIRSFLVTEFSRREVAKSGAGARSQGKSLRALREAASQQVPPADVRFLHSQSEEGECDLSDDVRRQKNRSLNQQKIPGEREDVPEQDPGMGSPAGDSVKNVLPLFEGQNLASNHPGNGGPAQ